MDIKKVVTVQSEGGRTWQVIVCHGSTIEYKLVSGTRYGELFTFSRYGGSDKLRPALQTRT